MNSNPHTGASDIVPLSVHDSEGSDSHTHGLATSQQKNLGILGYPLLVFIFQPLIITISARCCGPPSLAKPMILEHGDCFVESTGMGFNS